ncbi:MAG: DUF4381 domain-containing protein [Alphaproteobacteria bacterium]|nr:DUF4381 domain-containing protein [Alphaproteobacteria bacterium]
MDNLPELRDIHLPDSIPFFPLAYGWWGVIAFVIGVFILYKVGVYLWRKSARIYARRILLSLKGDIGLESAVKMSEILRRACVRKYPEAVAKTGDDWLQFLNLKSKYPLQGTAAELLKNAPFMNIKEEVDRAEDMEKVWRFCYDWIGANL